jgi:hypothetical protein
MLAPGQELTPIVSASVPNGRLLGLFNLSDAPARLQVDWGSAASINDFWTGHPAELPAGPILLPPRSARGFYLRACVRSE